MKAIVIGATGATGRDLLELLIADEHISSVDIFVRREMTSPHEKVSVHTIDFDKPDTWRAQVQGDVLFSTLGTTLKAAGSKEAQWRIDYDYQLEFAKIAHANGVPSYILVSSMLADSKASSFYLRMKGALDEAIEKIGFESVVILRPPLLLRKGSDRTGEKLMAAVLTVGNSIGLCKAYRPMSTETLARAMLSLAWIKPAGYKIVDRQEIRQFLQ